MWWYYAMMPRAVKPIFFTAYSIKDAMKKLNIPLGTPKPLFVDGPFTSRKEAEEKTRHWKKSKGKLFRHAAAAAIILERWLSDLTPEHHMEYKQGNV